MSAYIKGLLRNRRTSYFSGLGLTALGLIIVLPVLVAAVAAFEKPGDFTTELTLHAIRAVAGTAFVVVGFLLMTVGSPGLNDSEETVDKIAETAGEETDFSIDEPHAEDSRTSAAKTPPAEAFACEAPPRQGTTG